MGNNIKKYICLCMALTLAFGVVACGGQPGGNSGGGGNSGNSSTSSSQTDDDSSTSVGDSQNSSTGDVLLENGMPNYEAIPADEFIVNGWVAPKLTKAAYREYKECGFNYVFLMGPNIGGADSANVETALGYCDELGIKAFVDSSGYEENIYSLAALYNTHPSFVGFNYDEPVIQDNTLNNRKGIINMSSYAENLANTYNDVEFLVNLNPSSNVNFPWGTDPFTYEEYLDALVAYINTPYAESNSTAKNWLSCDDYPLCKDGNNTPYLKETWLENLGYLAVTKRDAEMPLASNFFIQSMPYYNIGENKDRTPTYNDLRLQLYTLMAFGYDSVSFHCYYTPNVGPEFLAEHYALIDRNGNKTHVYNDTKKLLGEIAKFSNTYMHFNDGWRGVALVTGSANASERNDFKNLRRIGDGTNTQEMNSAIISSVVMGRMGLTSVTATQDTVVGCMKDENNHNGFMVVNYNDAGLNKSSSVEMTFKAASYTKAWVYIDGERTEVALASGKLTLNLDVGEGVFVIPFKE